MPGENEAAMRRMIEIFAIGDLSAVGTVVANRYEDHQDDRQGWQDSTTLVEGIRRTYPDL